MKRKRMIVFIIAFAVTTSGCSLVPKEEVLPQAPVIATYHAQEYETIPVMRGDIVESVAIACTYQAYRTESLSFGVDGIHLDHVYVKEGDKVKAGDILADLEMDDLQKEIETYQDHIEILNQELINEKELKQLAVINLNKLKAIKGFTNRIKLSYTKKFNNSDSVIRELTDNIHIENERLRKSMDKSKKYKLVAGFDGMVSSISDYKVGDTSIKDLEFITIYDPSSMAFVVSGNDSHQFKIGDKVTIHIAKESFKAQVCELKDILTSKELENQDSDFTFYLKLIDPVNTFQIGTHGNINLILNKRKNVLYLPSTAIHNVNGKSVVYVAQENGYKSIKEIQTGLSTDNKVEITSGLMEGDIVILK